MKTKETENKKQKFVPGFKPSRDKFFDSKTEKFILFLLLLLLLLQLSAKVNANKNLWQLTISSGIHSFYAPVENLRWDNSAFTSTAGVNRILGEKQNFSLGLQAQFAQNKYQGDATSVQFLGQFLPVIFKKMELGIGTGAGYRFSGYPSSSLKWNGNSWEKAKRYKGIIQIPLQLSAGYRSFSVSSLLVTPFVAYQMQAMFGYNPDFDPLPDSNITFGFKFKFN